MHEHLVAVSTIIMLVMLFAKIPVFISVLSGSLIYFVFNPSINPIIVLQRVISGVESIPLLAVPFFFCAGIFMNYTGVTRRIMDFCEVLTGRMAGGLAQVNVLLSTMMGGLSGSNMADAAMEAKMLVPEMVKKGYSNAFSSVITAVSAMITPLIPPGIAMIIYGSIANVSIGKLFIAGIGPGLLLTVAMMILVSIQSKKRGYKPIRTTRVTGKEFWAAFKPAILPLCLPIIIIGGIRIGAFTATEAGAVSIIYSLILGFIYKEMSLKSVFEGLKEAASTTGSIMLICGAASAFAWVLTRERVPQSITESIVGIIDSRFMFLLVVNAFLIVVGMFIEGNAAMIVLVPLLVPIARMYGIDDIQFAMTVIFNLAVGCVTPPMGTLMFVTCGITGCKLKDFMKECLPYYGLLFICLMLITYVPIFSTGVVNLLW